MPTGGVGVESSLNHSVAEEQWDRIAETLRFNGGVATVDFLPQEIMELHANSFAMARRGLDAAARALSSPDEENLCRMIGPNEDSAHATGYHKAGSDGPSMSRYNSHREGFVFSDGNLFNVGDITSSSQKEGEAATSFQTQMEDLFTSMHDGIAINVLRAIARNLGLEREQCNWFESIMGPTNKSSQWHIKRYVSPTTAEIMASRKQTQTCEEKTNDKGDNGSSKELFTWLPVHTDPSLISIVLHDVPGKNENAMGLQYQAPVKSPHAAISKESKASKAVVEARTKWTWKEVEFHGHAVATVFVGSVLSYITGGLFPGAKHRVVYLPCSSAQENPERVAATLFVRPRGDAILAVPPSPLLIERDTIIKRNTTFNAWLSRVSRNYMKRKKEVK